MRAGECLIWFVIVGISGLLSGCGDTGIGGDSKISLILVPEETPPTLDGSISPGEWEEAAIESFADGSQLRLIQAGDYLYLGIIASSSERIAANIFIQRDDLVTILHSSAALGTAVYRQDIDEWQKIQDFNWCCRSTGTSESAQAERVEFLQEEDWLAANGMMGTPNEMEYQIKIPEQDFRLAAVYIKAAPPYEKIPWPTGLADDCIQPASGGLPEELHFSPEQWARLERTK